MCSPARLLIPQDCLFCYDCLYPWAIFHPHFNKFQEVISLMAITGIFFGSDTGNTENIAKMIQKQLGKDVADVHDIAKAAKKIWKHMTFCCWASQPGITAKRSVTGMTSSRLSKRLISMANWLRCLVVATRKITLNTSVTHWAPSATSLNRAVQPSLVTGQLRATISKHQKVWQMTTTLSVWLSTKTVSRN